MTQMDQKWRYVDDEGNVALVDDWAQIIATDFFIIERLITFSSGYIGIILRKCELRLVAVQY